jgi:hypothetical protein
MRPSFAVKIAFYMVLNHVTTTVSTSQNDISNGRINCDSYFCTVECDYGYIAAGRKIYHVSDPALEKEARCVEIMAVLVGNNLRIP